MSRIAAVVLLLALVASLALSSGPAAAERSFPETGFSVANESFLRFFECRGGVRVLGYPISREFDLLGTRVQLFQRAALQLRPDGGVGLLNLLDQGLLPFTRANGSIFPTVNPLVARAAPSPEDPDYGERALEFVRANAPDLWEGIPVGFYSTFAGTVSYEEAFPEGDAPPGLLPLINLEIWGMPTSRPTYDPGNRDFVYLRFQRGIMHHDRSTGLTRGILVGDYAKSLITGRNLPPDLAREGWGSPLYLQYDSGRPDGLSRPSQLPGSNLLGAFEPDGAPLPAPAPAATREPLPTPALAPPTLPTPLPSPTPLPAPAEIEVVGSTWFVETARLALKTLESGAPEHYARVKRFVYRIEETAMLSSVDHYNRVLRIEEAAAMPSAWRHSLENQAEWLAGLLVHNAVHVEQFWRGSPFRGVEAEQEARTQQRDVLSRVETTYGSQFSRFVGDAIGTKDSPFGCWDRPRDPDPAR